MALENIHTHAHQAANENDVIIRRIDMADIREALAKGREDFMAMPSHVVFISIIYPILGLLLSRFAFGYDMLPIIFPLISGFALVGPIAAIGLYELSRRREQGLETGWKQAFSVLRSPAIGSIILVSLVLMSIFVVWLSVALMIYDYTFGGAVPASVEAFLRAVLTTPAGWTLIIAGTGVGFLFAVVALMVGAVSFPLLLDRRVGAAEAMHISARAVLKNPAMMAVWGFIVAALLVIGSLPFLVGLALVLPVLGHATWHLYRRLVAG